MKSKKQRGKAARQARPEPPARGASRPATSAAVPVWKRDWAMGLALMVVTLLAYGPALRGGFLWDDDSWTTGIHGLLKDAKGLGAIWFQPTALQQYYPLTATTFWLDYQFWGFWTTPYHVENVLLHGLSAVMFWRLLRRLKVPGAWLAGWIMALHPMMVESAAWITERKNVLSLALYLGSLLAYGRYAGYWEEAQGKRRDYWLALGMLLGALLAKTTAFSLPAVLLLLCWWRRGRLRWKEDVLPTVPFFVLAVGLSFVTAWLEKHHVGAQGPEWDLSFGQRCLVAGRVVWFYAGKVFWPVGLCFVYPRWDVEVHSLLQWLYPLGALAVVAGLWVWRKRLGRGPLTAVLIFAGTLFPVLGFMNAYYMRFSFVCDHWAYLSGLGLMALGAAGLARWAQRMKLQGGWLGAGLAVVLGLLTWRQCGMYRDVETLWRTTLALNPKSNLAHNNLGFLLLQEGRVDDAITEFRAALEFWPNFTDALNDLGKAYLQKNQLDDAIALFQKALAIDPTDVMVHDNLGAAFLRKGRLDEATAQFRQALELKPDYASSHNNLAIVLLHESRVDEAIMHLQKALEIQPGNELALKNLNRVAWLLATCPDASIRNGPKAVELAREADTLTGGANPMVAGTLAAAYAETGRFPDALAAARRATQAAEAQGDSVTADALRAQMKNYEANQPFRDNAGAPKR